MEGGDVPTTSSAAPVFKMPEPVKTNLDGDSSKLDKGAEAGGGEKIRSPPGETSESEDETASKYIGPYKQLWPVLLGKTDLLDLEVIHEQLRYRRNDLLSVYMYQKKPFTQIPLRENASFKDILMNALANKWRIPESEALKVFTDYVEFEYNGVVKGLSELLSDPKFEEKLLMEVENFFCIERICKLYCTQVILGQATDETKPYHAIFAEFITSPGTLQNWTETICQSYERASNDDERVQILHTLTILLAENAEFEGVMQRFVEHYQAPRENRNSKSIMLAEAVLMYAFLQCGLDDKNSLITRYLDSHGVDVLENKYLLGAYICAFKDRCQEQSQVGNFIRRAPNPEECVQDMIELLEQYDADSFRNKHGLSDIVARAIAFAAEIILGSFHKDFFGNSTEWLKLFCTLMKNPTISATFLRDRPRELFNLYETYAFRFPIDAQSILMCWRALVTGGSASSSVPEILQDLINMVNIAERFEDIEFVREKQPQELWETTQNRHILGVVIPAGTTATMLADSDSLNLLVWNVAPSIHAMDVWRIYYQLICKTSPPQVQAETMLEFDYTNSEGEELTCVATEFIIAYLRQTANIPEHMLEFSNFIADSLLRLVEIEDDKGKKCRLLGLYINLVQSLSTFDSSVFLARADGLIPSPEGETLISSLILRHESLLESDLSVTIAFLDLIATLFRPTIPKKSPFNISEDMQLQFQSHYIFSIVFICRNVLHGLTQWKIPYDEQRHHELFINCLRIFVNLFSVYDKWQTLKDACCAELTGPKSALLYILKTTEEYAIQESMIKTTTANRDLPKVVDLALNLIVKLVNYKREVLHTLDNHSGLAIVQKLGRMLRHRVNTTIPTLSVLLLKKFAEESNMSLLCCLGEDLEPFCDHVLQRLEYETEDTNLKASILDFLTICSQTQVALIHRLMEDNKLLDQIFIFLTKAESNLVISSCAFIRALIVTDNILLKRYKPNIWTTIFTPIKEISKFLNRQIRKKIITTTLNTITYEIHRRGFIDQNFDNELRDLFRGEQWALITEAALEGQDEDTIKCVLAVKHFLILLHGSKEVKTQQHYRGPLQAMLEQITEAFWLEKELQNSSPEIRTTLAEIMVILAPSAPDNYLEPFCQKLAIHFFTDAVCVQLPLLSCVNKCVWREKWLSAEALECILKIITKILEHDILLFSSNSSRDIHVLFIVACRTLSSILRSQPKLPGEWPSILHRHMITRCIVQLVNKGLTRGEVPEFIRECMDVLIGFAQNSTTSPLVRSCDLSYNIWIPIVNYMMNMPAGQEQQWMSIYDKCFQLNAVLILTESQYYMHGAIEFWVLHALFLSQKLDGLTYLANHFLLEPDDKAYEKLAAQLELITSGCWSVVATLPFLKEWRIRDGMKVPPLMQSIMSAVSTASQLLSSPHNLFAIITKPVHQSLPSSFSASVHFKLTPELLELQHKLWEFLNAAVNVLWKIQKNSTMLNFKTLCGALITTVKVAVKTLTRTQAQGEKKSTSSRVVVSDSEKVVTILEKSFATLLCRITMKLGEIQEDQENDPHGTAEQILELKREISPDITSLCEGIRNCTPENEVLHKLCSVMEQLIKIPAPEG